MTRHDLDTLRRSLPADLRRAGSAAAFHVLANPELGVGEFVQSFLNTDSSHGAKDLVRAVTELYPHESWPALLLFTPPHPTDRWAITAVKLAEQIVIAEPRLAVDVALPHEEYGRLLAAHRDGRLATLLREGFVDIRSVTRNELAERLQATGTAPTSETLSRLVELG